VVSVGVAFGPKFPAGGEQRRPDSGRHRQAQSCQHATDVAVPSEDSNLPGLGPGSSKAADILGSTSYRPQTEEGNDLSILIGKKLLLNPFVALSFSLFVNSYDALFTVLIVFQFRQRVQRT
jgi:hypothetical protein